MRREASLLIVASLLASACGVGNTTSAANSTANSESAASISIRVATSSLPREPAVQASNQGVAEDPGIVIRPTVQDGSAPATPSYLAESVRAVEPVTPSTIAPLIVAQSAGVESVSVAPKSATTPAVTAPPAPVQAYTGGSIAAKFTSDINVLRAGLGISALVPSAELDSLALGWAQRMAADNNMRHSTIIHSLVNQGTWTSAAENIGYGLTETIVFDALVASPSRYVNMVNPTYTHVGTAVVVAGDLIWTVHLFVG